MTTIDERLEALTDTYDVQIMQRGATPEMLNEAIKSLFLDLIAEAKPEIVANNGPVILDDCQRGLDHYENNLIQAINGGKK
jgi:hypothetical protein